MEKVKIFLAKYKTYVVALFLVIFVFKSCGKNNDIKRLNKTIDANAMVVDSLNKVIIAKGLETEESVTRHFSTTTSLLKTEQTKKCSSKRTTSFLN